MIKLNQSLDNLKITNQIIQNKINISFDKRINDIISSTSIFINNNNKFNLDYIKIKINKENIFEEYFSYKINLLNEFFDTLNINIINNENDDINLYKSIISEDNYNYLIKNIEKNYSEFIFYLNNEIDENFTTIICSETIKSDISDSEYESDSIITEYSNNKSCQKERFHSNLNYSKYNFNIVKLRKELSNSKKFPEMFNQLFDDMDIRNITNLNYINKIDDIINNKKNILYIFNKTNYKSNQIKNEFFSLIQEIFENFRNDFINKNINLNKNYDEIFKLYKNLINFEDIYYNNNISEINNYILNNINKLLYDFNSTLFNNINKIMNKIESYKYYSINFTLIYKNYLNIIDNSFNNYISKIENIRANNLLYFIPKKILDEIFLNERKNIGVLLNNFSKKFDFSSIGFNYDIFQELDIYLIKYYISYELNNSNYYFEFMENIQNNVNIYMNKLINDICDIKNITKNKFNLIFENFIEYFKNTSNYVEYEYIQKIEDNNIKCSQILSELYLNIFNYLNYTNISNSEYYKINNCSIEKLINSLLISSDNDICLNISKINNSFNINITELLNCKNNDFNNSYFIIEDLEEDNKNILDQYISNIEQILIMNIIDENFLFNYIKKSYIKNNSFEININDYQSYFEDIQDMNLYINNLREPEYKNLMYNILVESFNTSYMDIISLFINNEIKNSINTLVNDKLNIFINYYSNKL